MKNKYYYWFAIFTVPLLINSNSSNAQCAYTDGGSSVFCTLAAPTTVGSSITCNAMYASEIFRATNMLAGCTYRISTCGALYNTQITVFPAGGGASQGYNDNIGPACVGLQASLDFTPALTGNYDMKLNEFNCTGNSTDTDMTITLMSLLSYNMPGGTINTCTGNFYDSGGSGGDYSDNENITTTFCSNSSNCIQVAFSAFEIEGAPFDYLYIYNGPSIASPLIGTYSGTNSPGTITSTTGCLTFRFTTDGSVVFSGWAAALSCVPCPSIAPPNDNCSGAIAVAIPSTTTGTTATATVDNPPFCGTGSGTAGGVWYSLTGNGNFLTAGNCTGTSYNSKIRVYEGSCSLFTCIAGNDDSCGVQAQVSWCSTVGTTYYILQHGSGSSSGTFSLAISQATVNAPVVTPSGPSICPGDSVSLTASNSGTYSWSPPAGLSATTGVDVTASPAATTAYTVTGTDVNGCSKNTMVTVTVSSFPTVTVSPNTSVCTDSSTTLTAGGASTYSWSPSTGLSATTGPSVTASPIAATTYTVTGTNSTGCSNMDSVAITVEQPPAAGFIFAITTINTVEFDNTSTSNLPFASSWDFGDGSPGATTPDATHAYANPGVYTVQLTVTSDCGTSIFTQEVTISGANSVSEFSTLTNINVFPNPSLGGVFELVIENVTTNKLRISVLDFTGRVIYRSEEAAKGEFRKTLNLSSFSKGIYSLKVESDNGMEIRKLVVQ